ncbi:MAG: glycosyltransferase family 2 protein [Sporocytophaga sp.]|uniref:glycosyltransferase family 2 protein n=1 Tax=Sporocytophaga sp. TaxID=2231183 RepID=UPI001B0720D4|nr:glycosyltransferase family 2 protein [Sporocytophaga sp.]MBO9701504.1 glycosyltransferase family 2 protein [Sporocytophaga sp.]
MENCLDIVLPCYNPLDGWEVRINRSIKNLNEILPDLNINLIVVNDGSPNIEQSSIDYLFKNLKSFQFNSYNENKGKGFALRKGLEYATSEIIIYTDVDFPFEEINIVEIYNKLKGKEADIIVGVRDQSYYSTVPKTRILISKIFKYFSAKLLNLSVTDTQCGLKGFNNLGKSIYSETTINRYLFDLEFIYLACKRKGVKLISHQVSLRKGVTFSNLNIKILTIESLSFFRILIFHFFNLKR